VVKKSKTLRKRVRRWAIRSPTLRWFITSAYSGYLGFVHATTRWQYEGFETWEPLLRAGKPFVIVHWHQRLAMMPFSANWRHWGMTVLASDRPVADMAVVAGERRGIVMLRMSKRTSNTAMLRAVVRELQTGRCICISPDGPEGPFRVMKPGALAIATLGQVPIALVSYSKSNAITVTRSWDRFLFPLPFGRGIFKFSAPMELSNLDADMDRKTQEIRLAALLTELDEACDHACGRVPD